MFTTHKTVTLRNADDDAKVGTGYLLLPSQQNHVNFCNSLNYWSRITWQMPISFGNTSRIQVQENKMKLITEEISKVEFVVEGTGSKKKMFIEGVFLQGDIKNRNGRMYPMSTLEKEVGRYNEAFVSKGRALGELGHPDGPTVNLDRVSHKIVSLTKEGSNFRGKGTNP